MQGQVKHDAGEAAAAATAATEEEGAGGAPVWYQRGAVGELLQCTGCLTWHIPD
jgi:hypothetical protein